MSNGAFGLAEAITDTGPPLHLVEIGGSRALHVFSFLLLPEGVRDELASRGISLLNLGVPFRIEAIEPGVWRQAQAEEHEDLQDADAQVFCLAQAEDFSKPVLTDDLALRHLLETRGATVVGSVGILIRAYRQGILTRAELDFAIEGLTTASSLHLSVPFRSYLKNLLRDLR
jgi:predicted nucleic acid-binding protein